MHSGILCYTICNFFFLSVTCFWLLGVFQHTKSLFLSTQGRNLPPGAGPLQTDLFGLGASLMPFGPYPPQGFLRPTMVL